MASWEKFSRIVAEAKAAKKLDPVGHEDDDVDNDGDSDSSDSYLKKRRATVGAAIAADKKKKVEEAKQLDPVGQEDDDIDNDGDSDKTDSYLRNRRKVRSKIIQAKEEVEQIDEIAPLVLGGLALGGALAAGAAIKRAQDAAKSGVDAANKGKQIKNPGTGIAGAAYGMQKHNNALRDAMKQSGMESYEPEGELVDEGKADKKLPEHKRSAARLARYDNPSGALALGGGQQRARRAEHEERRGIKKEEFVGEDKEYRREMAKAAARERAEEKRSEENYRTKGRIGKKKEGPKLSTTPHRESESKNYADKEMGSIKLYDKATKKNKNVVGLVTKEENEIDEGMSMKDFKANRKKNERKEASVDARKRGHEGKEWHNTGRTYSTDEAKSRRAKMSDTDRAARHSSAVDPDNEDHDNYSADKTKNPKKLRKQKAMGELGEGYIEEKALSRAQQRFMGMVYAAKKGETPASPEVAKAAEGMSKKAAKDFAKTKHAGLPEKKEDVKEELSLVERILDEAIKGTIAGGTSRAKKYKIQAKDVRIKQIGSAALSGDKKTVKKLKKANENPTRKITERGEVEGKKSEEERKDEAKKNVKRGLSDPSALTRRAAVAGAARLKAEKEKTKRQRERQQYEKERRAEKKAEKQKELEKSYKEKKIKAAQHQSDKEEGRKERTKERMKQSVSSAMRGIKTGYTSDKQGAGKAADQALSNIGSVAGGILKAGKGIISAKMKERKEKRQDEKREKRYEKIRSEISKEEFSNWREEFILEVDDQTVQNEKQKVIDVSKKKNKIEINPNMSEECGCDEKEKETPKKDMRELPTKINLAKTKMRSAGVRNPIVMVRTEENENELEEGAAWTKKEGKSEAGGLNEKGRKSYERENPGSDLKAPSKKVGNPRRASFCARMSGMKAKLTSKKTANDPDSRINKSLRAWNC